MTESKTPEKYLAHFTSRENLEKIIESGFLLPASQTNSTSNSIDNNKICFFKGMDYTNKDILNFAKTFVKNSKKTNDFEEYVCILIKECDVTYVEFPNEKGEIKLSFVDLDSEFYDKLGIYVKAYTPVAINDGNSKIL